jgi:SET family sugar efflux transporter-like MFS transporter
MPSGPGPSTAVTSLHVVTEARPARGVRHALRRWFPLGLVLLAVGLSTAFAFPFLALFLTTEVLAGPVQVTIYLVAAPLSSVLVATMVGRLSDRWPIRRPLLIALACAGGLGAGLTAVVREYWLLFGVTVTVAALAGALLPQIFAYAREVVQGSEKAAVTMSTLRTLFSVAWVAGPPVAAALLTAGGFTLLYASAAAMYGVAAVVALVFLTAPAAARHLGGEPPPQAVAGPDAPRLVIYGTVAGFVLLQCAGNLGVQAMPLFLGENLGGDVGDAGLILGLCAALEIPLMLGLGVLAARLPLRRLLLAGPICAVGYFTLASVAHAPWHLAVGQLLNALSIAAVQGLGVTYVQDMLPRHPGRASTLFGNSFPIGSVLAAPVLGAAQHLGYRSPYVIGTGLAVAGLLLLLLSRPARPS